MYDSTPTQVACLGDLPESQQHATREMRLTTLPLIHLLFSIHHMKIAKIAFVIDL
jgi:hypothetical protein